MQGLPKHLNNRHDYDYIRANFPPEQWQPEWQKLLDNRFIWQNAGELKDGEGATDATHRVINEPQDPMDPESPTIRIQQELVEDSNARIFRLGFTVEEVAEALGVDVGA